MHEGDALLAGPSLSTAFPAQNESKPTSPAPAAVQPTTAESLAHSIRSKFLNELHKVPCEYSLSLSLTHTALYLL